VSSALEGLRLLGLTHAHMATAAGWARGGQAVSLRFSSATRCVFARKVERAVEGPTTTTTATGALVAGVLRVATSVSTKVTDYFFDFDAQWRLELVRGTGREAGDTVQLCARDTLSAELKSASEALPHHGAVAPPLEVPITWLLQQLEAGREPLQARVRIDRAHKDCATPRRNKDTDAGLACFEALAGAARELAQRVQALQAVERQSRPNDAACRAPLHADGLFLPYILFEEAAAPAPAAALALVGGGGGGGGGGGDGALVPAPPAAPPSPLMDLGSINRLLAESFQGLQGRCDAAAAELPPATAAAITSASEGRLLVVASYLGLALARAADGVGYIEGMLRAQVCEAVGKVLQPADFAAYMRFHARRLFRGAFAPRPMCFSVRRSSEHSPEGVISIVEASASGSGAPADPIFTVSARVPGGAGEGRYMDLALSAETRVRFGGERHLHAWLSTRFTEVHAAHGRHHHHFPSPSAPPALSLRASSRQFSSFILCVGKLSSATSFDPVAAIIVKDKDELTIPLAVAELPTPQAFKDAIESLSEEQQRFCKAFRAMQLESTLFAVLVLHIKPQLEVLLRLAPDSLTKEVALTQDLMNLFIDYQIPADLMSFGGDEGSDRATRLAAVKGHVAGLKAMIKAQQDADIEQRRQEARYEQPLPPPMREQEESYAPQMMMCRSMAMPMSAPAPPPMPAKMGGGWSNLRLSKSAAPPPRSAARPMDRSAGGGGAASASVQMDVAAAAPPVADSAPAPVAAAQAAQAAQPAAGAAPAGGAGDLPAGLARDLTKVPAELDAKYLALDSDAALRACTITPSGPWTKSSLASILAKPVESSLGGEEQGKARSAAFDLLDALSRSGALPIENAALHVVMGAVHRFEEGLMDTVVKGNIKCVAAAARGLAAPRARARARALAPSHPLAHTHPCFFLHLYSPIEKAERSLLIMATVRGCP
jgi:hypothetical protein